MGVATATPDTTIAGSTFRWLRTGEEAFAVMLDAIARARWSIRLETYIYRAGTVGERFRALRRQEIGDDAVRPPADRSGRRLNALPAHSRRRVLGRPARPVRGSGRPEATAT